jgi:hypothetical protein
MDADPSKAKPALLRKLKNLYLGCVPEFVNGDDSALRFRLIDSNSKYRSNLVCIWPSNKDWLKRSYLEHQIKWARRSDMGQPRVRIVNET